MEIIIESRVLINLNLTVRLIVVLILKVLQNATNCIIENPRAAARRRRIFPRIALGAFIVVVLI